jgi:hypothetical protein
MTLTSTPRLDVYKIEPPDENPDGSVGPSERLRRA